MRDAEELALLRSSHELKLLDAVKEIKKQQIEEAKETLEGLKRSKKVIEARRDYYRDIEFMNEWEIAHLVLTGVSAVLQAVGGVLEIAAASATVVPDAYAGGAGSMGSPLAFAQIAGGSKTAASLQSFGRAMNIGASLTGTAGSMSATMGSYWRRWDDWRLQEKLASKELEQIDRQIAAADIRKAITERELQNHDLQVENAKEVDEYMQNKFTNRELYDWMVGQIAAVYFQSYQLAYDIAKRAERTYRFELGLTDSNFIQFGYWDSLKKGLLAGEKLHYDLKRMEMAYLDQNRREYEITKHISLAMLDPVALVKLKETGECFVNLPEAIFDLDYPGHYMRRIKSVSLTIPCVTGPYTSVNCTLTLLKNSVRKVSTLLDGNYSRQDEDPRFTDNIGAIQSIATSSAQNDSGIFELNFRDERYLPFEGAGEISEWRLELPKEFKQFDYDTISDVILHLRYTAREGGGLLKEQAIEELKTMLEEATLQLAENRKGLFRLFSAKHEFPSNWHKFLHPSNVQDPTLTLELNLSAERFPFQFRGKTIEIDQVGLFVKRKDSAEGQSLELFLTPPNESVNDPMNPPNDPTELLSDPTKGNLLFTVKTYSEGKSVGKWVLKARKADIDPIADVIEDIGILCHYSVTG